MSLYYLPAPASPTRRRFAANLNRARAPLTAALGSGVANLRTRPEPVELMPGVTLYDHEADPDDVPVLPDLVALALSVLLRSVDVPGSVSRPHTCEASAIVRGHFRVGADDCNPQGMPRPVTA